MVLSLGQKLSVLCCVLGVIWGVSGILSGCGLTGETKKFDCQDVNDCGKKSLGCVDGKCVVVDVDKDGWSRDKDCDDRNWRVYPKAPEICGNNVDDDCDSKIDEEPCVCLEGSEQECGSDKGVCRKGKRTCVKSKWSACLGDVPSEKEICDGKDNDCNGSIDDGVKGCCTVGEERECGLKVGLCKPGKQKCEGKNAWSLCVGQSGPVDEVCDGKDNDCDGKVDNIKGKETAIRQPCYEGSKVSRNVGTCSDGFQTCVGGKWGVCKEQKQPEPELCDNKDNDCDGFVDNQKGRKRGLLRECFGGPVSAVRKGICRKGVQVCVQGRWGACLSEQKPGVETCNGRDDDCDGKVDNQPKSGNSLSQTCYHGLASTRTRGTCADGRQVCEKGKWGLCKGAVLPTPEICDGKDNDCDGRIDNITGRIESLKEVCFTGPSFERKRGECRDGVRTCRQGKWSTCEGERTSSPEICDNKDNDCDGVVDEDVTRACYSVAKALRNQGACKDGIQQCNRGTWLSCQNEVKPSREICNKKDDDCDGQVDEKDSGSGSVCRGG